MRDAYLPSNSFIERLRRRAALQFFRSPVRLPQDKAFISFSFDDFPKSAAQTGAAILEEHGVRGTYYVSLGLHDRDDHQGLHFSFDDVKSLHARGHELACHGYSHLDSARVSVDEFVHDLEHNQQTLHALLGGDVKIENFAYPFGNITPLAKRQVRELYASCRSVRAGINRNVVDLACLRAFEINERSLSACLSAIEDVKAKGGWLIFFTHDVRDNPSNYGCTPETFRRVVSAATQLADMHPADMQPATGVHPVRDVTHALGIGAQG